jgi:hypothetical protein
MRWVSSDNLASLNHPTLSPRSDESANNQARERARSSHTSPRGGVVSRDLEVQVIPVVTAVSERLHSTRPTHVNTHRSSSTSSKTQQSDAIALTMARFYQAGFYVMLFVFVVSHVVRSLL